MFSFELLFWELKSVDSFLFIFLYDILEHAWVLSLFYTFSEKLVDVLDTFLFVPLCVVAWDDVAELAID